MAADFREACLLIEKGWSPELAFSVPRYVRQAACIVHGEHDGGVYDHEAREWVEKEGR